MDWKALRSEFPVTNRYVYLDHAGVSPLPLRVSRAMSDFVREVTLNGTVNSEEWHATVEECRRLRAKLMNAGPDKVAFTKNTTQGLLIAANGTGWRKGDNVVITNAEFQANVYPWMSLETLGVETHIVEERDGCIPVESIESAIDSITALPLCLTPEGSKKALTTQSEYMGSKPH